MERQDAKKRVLVVGFRPQIVQRLTELRIPFAVWHDKKIKQQRLMSNCLRVLDASPFPLHQGQLRTTIKDLIGDLGPMTDVIAGTESSVVPATVARRVLNARRSVNTVILRCHHKRLMKRFLSECGIPVTPFLSSRDRLSSRQIVDRLGLPIVVKPLQASGGRGQTVVQTIEELDAVRSKNQIYEQFVDAPEISIESFINQRSIRFASTTQYVVKRHVNLVPAAIAPDTEAKVLLLNQRIVEALKIQWGMTHAEYFILGDQILFGEIALRPPGGYIMELMEMAHGFSAWNFFVDNELEVARDVVPTRRDSAAAVVFHPGPGEVADIRGVEALKRLPAFQRMNLLVRPGQVLSTRQRASEIAAYCLFSSPDQQQTLSSALKSLGTLEFELVR
jgi:hypothetical protein